MKSGFDSPRPHQLGPLIRKAALAALVAAAALTGLRAFTMQDLLSDAKMTPKRFAGRFADFEFEFNPYVQDPDVFLQRQRGDCADYAIMADYVLKRKQFETRIIRVALVGTLAHDVCYVTQVKAYLDYNNRVYFKNLERSGRSLREIAEKVAASFDANWTSVSVYTFDYGEGIKHLTLTVVKTDPPSEDADSASPGPAK